MRLSKENEFNPIWLVTMERCRNCYLAKPEAEREKMNWDECRKEYGKGDQ